MNSSVDGEGSQASLSQIYALLQSIQKQHSTLAASVHSIEGRLDKSSVTSPTGADDHTTSKDLR